MRSIEFAVLAQLPPLKGEARSMLSPAHPQAARVRALLEASHQAKLRERFSGFGTKRIGMKLIVSPVGAAVGDATNALGGVGDSLQARRTNIDLSYLGHLADAVLFQDDAQIRDVRYRDEPGELGYRLAFWTLDADENDDPSVVAETGP